MGALISSGHDPDHLLSTYSWEQLAVYARCVARSRIGLVNGLLGPMVGAVGGEFTGHRVPDGKAKGKRKRPAPPNTKDHRRFSLSSVPEEHRDVALLSAFRSVGIGIKG